MTTITIGGSTYEIHGTEAGANAYFNGRLNTAAWDDASILDRRRGLVMAANWLARFEESTPKWTGEKTGGSGQALPWPRDGASCNGVAVTDGTTPAQIITGEYELALALLADPTVGDTLSQGSIVKRAKGGSAEVEFFGPSRGGPDDTPVPAIVWQLIGCFMEGATVLTPTVNGNEDPSSFCPYPSAGLSEGYA